MRSRPQDPQHNGVRHRLREPTRLMDNERQRGDDDGEAEERRLLTFRARQRSPHLRIHRNALVEGISHERQPRAALR